MPRIAGEQKEEEKFRKQKALRDKTNQKLKVKIVFCW